ncbi:MAG: glutamate 5-kinase [Coriobacteriia bacterium]|nr:glutamate 5-kinase [Coriobacteriia bacterium]
MSLTEPASSKPSYQRVVVKIGSSSLTDEQGRLDKQAVARLAEQVKALRDQGTEVVVVSSAAISAGLERIGYAAGRPSDLPTLQAAAAIGQLVLSQAYAETFADYGLSLGQVLLTRFELENRSSYLHARDTLERLLELGFTPLINENDTVAVEEIRFGDNDTLAAQVGILVRADLVVLLSDIQGLYTADPRIHEDAKLLESIGSFTREVVEAAGAAGSARGSGGMITKLEAARMCMAAGIPMVICHGSRPNAVLSAVSGQSVGTLFGGETTGHAVSARKLWQALAGAVKGSLNIDAGAQSALEKNGSSLLAVGIRSVEGRFEADSVVDIRSLDGMLIGRGLSAYSSQEAALAAGKKSTELAEVAELAHLAHTAVVHRDRLVIF